MAIVDFILNLAGLLLWFGWRQSRTQLVVPNAGISLLSTLKRADTGRQRTHFLPLLLGLLFLRTILYWQLGSALNWVASLPLGVITLSFRSRLPGQMLVFSFASFGLVLATALLWLIVLSVLHPRTVDSAQHRFVRTQIGFMDRWPSGLRLLLPLVAVAALWAALSPALSWLDLQPAAKSIGHIFEQAGVHGIGFYFHVRWLFVGVLLLHVLNSYVYLGTAAFWTYIQQTAQVLLLPLRWIPLQFGRIDFAPVLGLALVFALCEAAERGLWWIYQRLPF
jgi:uncharacterized protein YggT (Ycf19 family)